MTNAMPSLYSRQPEKSRTDKVLAKDDATKIETIIQKDELSLQDLRQLTYLLASIESKLHYFDDNDRYILGKYLIWIRGIVTVQELTLKAYTEISRDEKYTIKSRKAYEISKQMLNEDIKFHATEWLYWARSSLSMNGEGFKTLNTQSIEYEYNQKTQDMTQMKKGWFNIGGR